MLFLEYGIFFANAPREQNKFVKMKKIFTGLFMSLVLSSGVNAQTINQGDQTINLGFGFDPYYRFSSWNGSKRSAVGPIVLGYEYIVTDKLGIGRIGVGGILGQSFYNEKYSNWAGDYRYKISRTAIIGRAAYHFDLPVKGLDLYAGVGGGFYINHHVDRTDYPNGTVDKSTRTSVSGGHYVFGGVRYFFTDAFGVYVEAGHGFNAINGGLSFKF
jgi:hypothetical protein